MERGLDLDPTSKAFFAGESEGAVRVDDQEIAELVGLTQGMEVSCSPSWLTKKRAGLFAGFLALGTVGLNEAKADFFEKQMTAESHEVSKETAEVAREHIAKMQRAFTEAAERVRTRESLEGFSLEERELVADELANFPVERLMNELAEMSGLGTEQLAVGNDVSFVSVFNDDDTYNYVSYVEKSEGGPMQGAAEEMIRGTASFSFERQAIFLNISEVKDDNHEMMRMKIRDVLTHEMIHGFKHDNFSTDTRVKTLYEGGVEDAANAVGPRVWVDMPQDPYSGYVSGGTALSQVIRGSMESQDYWQALLTDNLKRIKVNFDAAFGADAFSRSLYYGQARSYDAVPTYGSQAAILGFLQTMEEESPGAASQVLTKVNADRRTGKLYQWGNDNWQGLLVVSDQAETGFAGGFIEERNTDVEPKAVFVSGYMKGQEGTISFPRVDAAILSDRLSDYNGESSLDEAPAIEVQGAIDSLMNAYLPQFNQLLNSSTEHRS